MDEPTIDDATADRLLSGSIPPEHAPPGLAGVATALGSAWTAAARPLPGDPAFVARLAEAVRTSPGSIPTTSPQRKPMLTKLLTAKAAAFGGIAIFSATAAAASTGSLPSPAQDAVSSAFDKAGVAVPRSKAGARGNSEFGHCRAFLNSQRPAKDDDGTTTTTAAPTTTTTVGSTTTTEAPTTSTTEAPTTSTTEAPTTSTTEAPTTTTVATGDRTDGSKGSGKLAAPPFARLIEAHGGIAGTVTHCEGVVAAKKSKTTTSTTATDGTTTTSAPGKSGDAPGRSGDPGKSGEDHGRAPKGERDGASTTRPERADKDQGRGRPTTSTTVDDGDDTDEADVTTTTTTSKRERTAPADGGSGRPAKGDGRG